MIFTIAHIQILSEVRFGDEDRELLVTYVPTHPGNQKRAQQIRFSKEATHQLICAIQARDSAVAPSLETLLSKRDSRHLPVSLHDVHNASTKETSYDDIQAMES